MQVSVIIPAYNSARTLSETLQSAIRQTKPCEIIVVDDGSTDETPDLLAAYGDSIRVLRQTNRGVSAARNSGADIASGEAFLFLDADDRLTDTAVHDLSLGLARNAEIGFCHGKVVYFQDQTGNAEPPRETNLSAVPGEAWRKFYDSGSLPPSAFVVRRSVHEAIGGFSPKFSYAADLHYWMRCGTLSGCGFEDAVVLYYRVHAKSMSRNTNLAVQENLDARASFARWSNERGLRLTGVLSDLALVERLARHYFWCRKWVALRSILSIAAQRKIESQELNRLRRRMRLPGWFYQCKDLFDRLRKQAPPTPGQATRHETAL